MTTQAVMVLMDRVHVLEVTLEMMIARMTIIAAGGSLPCDSLLEAVAEARRVLGKQSD